ncbi:dihydrolipoyl dehydrogenase [Prosthecochloris sp. GSB1]|uniref:dihydrolipoyl dehydrogenase n=1 Tax=Prosthecochloris sp. GSB1 TaxID=281093 RepID=UPI000B8C7F6F|nr:dihydrolipoyl dehydrogenase [Prosthecochloris sp. GSB1]ASQ90234.1 dihydrolipoyl dehydrogenase [Prosthecochloris sp. GSB1]
MDQQSGISSCDFDVAVVGSGPGGFEAAVLAAREGLRVCVIEKGEVGGVCVNWGCIPTKALLRSAGMFRLAGEAGQFGLVTGETSVDITQAVKRSRRVVLTVSKGVEYSLKQSGVVLKRGEAAFVDARTLEIRREGQEPETVRAEHIVIATGARARELPGLPVDGGTIITSREALALKEAPGKMLIVGGGAIGVEMAWYFSSAGTEVTLVELMPRIMPLEDEEISEGLKRSLEKTGITVLTGATVLGADKREDGVTVAVRTADGEERSFDSSCVLLAVGVSANTGDLRLERAGVVVERGFIRTDGRCRTDARHVFAIGDVRGGMLLAHKASAEAEIAVQAIAGKQTAALDETRIPRCVYVEPSVASVGLSEEQARNEGYEVAVGKAMFSASGKASAYGNREGFVKLVFDADSWVMLGGHVLGHDAVELIGELTLARSLDATAHQILGAIHAHPTLSESVREAAGNAVREG